MYQLDLCVCVVIFTPLGADGYGKTTIVLDILLFGGRVPEGEACSVSGPLVSQSVLCFMPVHSQVILDPFLKILYTNLLVSYINLPTGL